MDVESATILDVRTVGEFMFGAVEGAVNVPLDEIPDQLDFISKLPKPLLVCCAHGVRSRYAVDYLVQNGIDEIYDVGAWQNVKEIFQ